jgi:tetratricopeptide (TPR) repeat protein
MSELVDQISKLEAKAHALKESVSIAIGLPLSRENTLRRLRNSMSWSRCKKSSMEREQNLFWNLLKKLQSFATSFPCPSCKKVSYIFDLRTLSENFNVALELLRKAETLTEEGDKYRAVTYNNFACIFRRTKKLRSALSYLEKALEIEYNYLHYSDESVDDCLQVLNPTDIHLNICAILSQMGKHELALQHSMKALILIQDELITKIMAQESAAEMDPSAPQEIKKPEDRLTVLCIAYHNIAVE